MLISDETCGATFLCHHLIEACSHYPSVVCSSCAWSQALLLLRLEHDDPVRGLLNQLFAAPPSLLMEDPRAIFDAGAEGLRDADSSSYGMNGLGTGDSGRNAMVQLLQAVCSVSPEVSAKAG